MNYFFKLRFFIASIVVLAFSVGSVASASHLSEGEVSILQAQINSALSVINELEGQLTSTTNTASVTAASITCPNPRITSNLQHGDADRVLSRNPIVRERGEVTALQEFLWQYKGRYSGTHWNVLNRLKEKSDLVTGHYGDRTSGSVKAFQQEFGVAYPNQKDIEFGKVFLKTRNAIALQCGALTDSQIDAILSLLRSFGAPAASVEQARVALIGGTPTYPGNSNLTQNHINAIVSLLQSFGARENIVSNVRFALTGSYIPLVVPAAPYITERFIHSTTTPIAVKMSYADFSNNETGFVLERNTVASSTTGWVQVKTLPANACTNCWQSVTDNSNLTLGTTYYYRLGAFNAAGTAYSSEAVVRISSPLPPPPPPPPGKLFRVFESSATSTPYRPVQAGSTNTSLAAYTIEGVSDEGMTLKQLAFQWGSPASSTPASLVGSRVTLWSGSVQIGEAIFSQAIPSVSSPRHTYYATSSPLNLVFGPNESKVITIKADLSTINAVTGEPGAFIQINYDGDNNGLNGNYAVGAASGATISGGSSDRRAEGVRAFRSVPTVVENSCGSNLLTTGVDLYCFTVTAGTGRDIGLRSVAFDVATSNAIVRDFQLYGPSGAVTGITNAVDVYDPANNSGDSNYLRFVFNDTSADRLIQAGTSKNYRLRANAVYGRGSGIVGSFSARLHEDTAYPRLKRNVGDVYEIENSLGYIPQEKSFLWTAFSTTTPVANALINSNADWSNGFKVSGFPLPWRTSTSDSLRPEPVPLSPIPWLYERAVSSTSTPVTVKLGYSDNGGNETGFVLERNTVASSTTGWVQIKTLPALSNCASYAPCALVTDNSNLVVGNTYYYRLGAFNAAGTAYSGEVTVFVGLTPPLAPATLFVSRVNATTSPFSIRLTWRDSSSNETHFVLERSMTSSTTGFTLLANPTSWCSSCTTGSQTYTDSSVAFGSTYYYRVKASNGVTESPYSRVVGATVTSSPLLATNLSGQSFATSYASDVTSALGSLIASLSALVDELSLRLNR